MVSHDSKNLISSVFLSAVVTSLSEQQQSGSASKKAVAKKPVPVAGSHTAGAPPVVYNNDWVTVASKSKSGKSAPSFGSPSKPSPLQKAKPKSSPSANQFSALATESKIKHHGKNYVPGKPASTKCSKKNQRRNARRRAAAQETRARLTDHEEEGTNLSTSNDPIEQVRSEQEDNDKCLLLELPYNILTAGVLSYLRPEEMASLGVCSMYAKVVTEEGYLWQTMFRQRFPQSQLSPQSMKEWKLAFQLSLSKVVDRSRCFSTKKTFFEDVLGVGVRFSVNPKTETVDYIELTQDLLSNTAFKENRIRNDAFGHPFELFLPLYFTEEHFQRALPLIRTTILRLGRKVGSREVPSFESMTLDVMPKIVNTIAVLLSDEGMSASYKSYLCLSRVHRLFLALAHKYPSIKREALIRLRKFSSDSNSRTKTACPSLGSILPLLMVVNEKDFGWDQLRVSYVTENFDRGVLWSCTKYPQLEITHDASGQVESAEKEEKRVALTLDAMTVSLRLCMFHVYFYKATCNGTTSQERANRYDRFFGQPDPEGHSDDTLSFTHFRQQINSILTVNKWHEFFSFIGLKCPPTKADMANRLRKHVKSSLQKKYHKRGMDFSRVHASGTSQILLKGQQYSASADLHRVVFTDIWKFHGETKFLDATCLVYKGKNRVHTIDYRHRFAENNAIRHSGDVMEVDGGQHTIHIDLEELDPEITTCVFVISAWADATLSDILSPCVSFSNPDDEDAAPLCTYDLDAQDKISYLTSVIMCKLYRTRGGGWHVQAIGDAHKGAADNYGPIYAAVDKLL